jgi:hypothetical protein
MKLSKINLAAGVAVILFGLQTPARADLQTGLYSLTTKQQGFEGFVAHGTIVEAHTNLANLWAFGTYRLECANPRLRPALVGSRGWSDNGLLGGKHIIVTVPKSLPAVERLPGWDSLAKGTRVDCVYFSTGTAKTSILPIGNSGTTVGIGGDEWHDSLTTVFTVIKPGTEDGGGCIV